MSERVVAAAPKKVTPVPALWLLAVCAVSLTLAVGVMVGAEIRQSELLSAGDVTWSSSLVTMTVDGSADRNSTGLLVAISVGVALCAGFAAWLLRKRMSTDGRRRWLGSTAVLGGMVWIVAMVISYSLTDIDDRVSATRVVSELVAAGADLDAEHTSGFAASGRRSRTIRIPAEIEFEIDGKRCSFGVLERRPEPTRGVLRFRPACVDVP